jgi:ABC-type phosphate transport system substrate-binding protein
MKNALHTAWLSITLLFASAASADIVLVVHPDSPLASMTPDQAASIYLGRDPRYSPVDLPESARHRHWFYYKVTGRDLAQVKTIWARLLAQRPPPKVARDSDDAVRFVAAHKNAIAYVERSAVDASVKEVMTVQEVAALQRPKD